MNSLRGYKFCVKINYFNDILNWLLLVNMCAIFVVSLFYLNFIFFISLFLDILHGYK
jgi:hypothetical protein